MGVQGIFRGLDNVGVISQAKIVIGTKIQDFPAIGQLDFRLFRAVNYSLGF